MKKPTVEQLKSELDKKIIKNLYLFTGEEDGEKEKYISRIIDLIFKDSPDKKNCISRFHLENSELMDAADFVLSQSIFYPVRLCVLYNIESLPANQNTKTLLQDMADNASSAMTVIMTSQPNNPPAVMTRGILQKTSVIQFWRHFNKDINHYIIMSLKKHGLTIETSALSLLVDLTGNDIRKIDDAIDMLRGTAQSPAVDVQAVKNAVHDVSDVTIFQYIDTLFMHNKKAFHLLNKLISNDTPELLILSLILRQTETIEKYYTLTAGGATAEEALKACGIYQQRRDAFWSMTRTFPPKKVEKVFPLIAYADYQLKSRGKTKTAIENPLMTLTSSLFYSL